MAIIPTIGNLPLRAHLDDAGADLITTESFTLLPGARYLAPTGTSIALPPTCVGLVCPRSGLAHKHGVTVLNSPGVIDAGYRGEIKVNLYNAGDKAVEFEAGQRIAQLVVLPLRPVDYIPIETLDTTERGDAGHGSTGR